MFCVYLKKIFIAMHSVFFLNKVGPCPRERHAIFFKSENCFCIVSELCAYFGTKNSIWLLLTNEGGWSACRYSLGITLKLYCILISSKYETDLSCALYNFCVLSYALVYI